MSYLKALIGALIAFAAIGTAQAKGPSDRQQILDAIRPQAAASLDQPVRIKVDTLNIDSGWAVLVGNLVGPPGKDIDWEKTSACNPYLDKMLWVVLKKKSDGWHVKHIDLCASEPPYWYMEQYGGFVWPCGVYRDLVAFGNETLETQCRREGRTR
ncbi:hypothetical protein ASE26_07040 [Duganella sp. Root198D2]|nr:hypothetical protein ASD07_22840 [Duganella sp. Root336D2]KRB87151.1 hypothetical protein ASE26_07040 [Duganella sp. Root198D2]